MQHEVVKVIGDKQNFIITMTTMSSFIHKYEAEAAHSARRKIY